MIKVGDYIKHKGNEVIYKVVSRSEKLLYVTDFKQTWQHIGVDVATNNYIVVDYKQLYEQQKQRADELEKRWSELKSLVVDKAHFYENKGYMHQGAILVDVVEEMEQLEKENEQ